MNHEESNLNPEPLQPREGESTPSERELAWRQKLADVDKLKDGLNKGVDEGIKESVATFLLHGFTTSQSCEGHIAEEGEKQHGLPHPWIDVNIPAPKGYKEATSEARKEMAVSIEIENLKLQRRMLNLLEEFYQGRETPFDVRLIAQGYAVGAFRMQSLGANVAKILPLEERKQRLELFRKEMKDFTAFLKNKYLSSEEPS